MGFVFLLPTLAVLPSKARLSTNWWLMSPAKDDPFCLQTQADSGWLGEAENPGRAPQAGKKSHPFWTQVHCPAGQDESLSPDRKHKKQWVTVHHHTPIGSGEG